MRNKLETITVFCGSSLGTDPAYAEAAYQLGERLAENNQRLVYGGAKVGLMGKVAEGCLNQGGTVIGVLPTFLSHKEIAHAQLSELHLVDSMHERKQKMAELAAGFVALPGGFGTLEEVTEILTWLQLGLHRKPIGLLNLNGFYDPLQTLFQQMTDRGFLKRENCGMALMDSDPDVLLQKMEAYQAPEVPKWIRAPEQS